MQEIKATSRQTWTVLKMTGYDIRDCDLSASQVDNLIQSLNNGDIFPQAQYPNAKRKWVRKYPARAKYAIILQEAIDNGRTICEMDGLKSESSIWCIIRPANCGFAQWLKGKGMGRLGHRGGLVVSESLMPEEYAGKEYPFWEAFAETLLKYGFNANVESVDD